MRRISTTDYAPVFFTKRFIPGPVWCHFMVAGFLLYLALGWLFPSPKPVLGPPSEARLDLLASGFTRMTGELPGETDIDRFVDLELRDELLFREALKLKLHLRDVSVEQRLIRNMRFLDPTTQESDEELVARAMDLNQHLTDEVIRRRLVQVMSQLITASSGSDVITESELEQAYEQRKGEFIAPARVSFSHVFLSDATILEAEEILLRVRAEGLTPREALKYGTAFLAGFDFRDVRWSEVNSRFGAEFTEAVTNLVEEDTARTGWVGAVSSVFGRHLIYVEDYKSARPQQFDEVVEQLRWDIRSRKEQEALDEVVQGMMASYEVRRR